MSKEFDEWLRQMSDKLRKALEKPRKSRFVVKTEAPFDAVIDTLIYEGKTYHAEPGATSTHATFNIDKQEKDQ